jgi:hypothetical protein
MRLLLSLALLGLIAGMPSTTAQPAAAGPPGSPVACRVLEAHADAALGVTVVVFHQRDDADRARVGALLRAHDGAAIEFQTSDGASHAATVMRLKACFGRGLLLFRSGGAVLAEKDEFLLREPAPGAR